MKLQAWSWFACADATAACTVTSAEDGETVRPAFTGALVGMLVQGRGKVVSDPAGLDCGQSCIAAFTKGATVRLSAQPQGSPFAQWSPGCGPTPTCDRTITGDGIYGASFGAPLLWSLPQIRESVYVTVGIGGAGQGTVTFSSPKHGSVACTTALCSRLFDVPESVTLSENANPGSRFTGWVAGCPASSGSCTVDTQFINSAALCFAPAVNPAAIQSVSSARANGRRRLTVHLAQVGGAKSVTFNLMRAGIVRATWAPVDLAEPPTTLTLAVPHALPRGRYALRASTVDGIGCRTTLAAHSVGLSRP